MIDKHEWLQAETGIDVPVRDALATSRSSTSPTRCAHGCRVLSWDQAAQRDLYRRRSADLHGGIAAVSHYVAALSGPLTWCRRVRNISAAGLGRGAGQHAGPAAGHRAPPRQHALYFRFQ